jgi:hypothetical protein
MLHQVHSAVVPLDPRGKLEEDLLEQVRVVLGKPGHRDPRHQPHQARAESFGGDLPATAGLQRLLPKEVPRSKQIHYPLLSFITHLTQYYEAALDEVEMGASIAPGSEVHPRAQPQLRSQVRWEAQFRGIPRLSAYAPVLNSHQ